MGGETFDQGLEQSDLTYRMGDIVIWPENYGISNIEYSREITRIRFLNRESIHDIKNLREIFLVCWEFSW
jgi:hypothetical protein